MRNLKRRILKNNSIKPLSREMNDMAIAGILAHCSTPKLRSSLPKKKQRELGMRPSVEHEIWTQKQEAQRRKEKCRKQPVK